MQEEEVHEVRECEAEEMQEDLRPVRDAAAVGAAAHPAAEPEPSATVAVATASQPKPSAAEPEPSSAVA
eukprot:scaffold101134_cov41-Phaeocystis_antarctica.AAC.2